MQAKELLPIWILNTKSFWLGIAPALLTLVDVMFAAATSGDVTPVASTIATILGWAFGWTPEQVFGAMKLMAPLYALIVAQQRSGITRPYASTPTAAGEKPAAVIVKHVEQEATAVVKDAGNDALSAAIKTAVSPRKVDPWG